MAKAVIFEKATSKWMLSAAHLDPGSNSIEAMPTPVVRTGKAVMACLKRKGVAKYRLGLYVRKLLFWRTF
ncbi:hypothetical protein GKC44_12520 [Lactobacillus parabuchneri]|uniref:Uncharacterized protein n=1 Tax=Lentilactobacillus parabuchneri TaxID=152331 RepID=A0A844EN81_9LACO|nr:hypothetical protein [Lentilactobacillus parabuchneri]